MFEDQEFKTFYLRHQPSLQSYARYLISSDEDAVEIVNDVFLNIWKRKDFNLTDEMKPYLFRSVKNRCINYLKKRKVEKTSLEDVQIEYSTRADHLVLLKEGEDLIIAITNTLPPRCRQVFLMSREDGLSNREISTLLDISIKTVENQMTKSLNVFRKKLKKE